MVFRAFIIICGIFLIGSGMWSAFTKKGPADAIGAFLALVGLMATIVGILMICVPGFFGG
ncbi:MAG: hypothetical protein DRH43_02505 [Deltaproteobacteria bacterium]|nr:MAG: hypothetical protein DRH50_01815 [Deltaproteobacteria bacterium]RLC12117.1 MAG: hypothetical protein DRH43_02505 [Deltaproteobacteria bacterium]